MSDETEPVDVRPKWLQSVQEEGTSLATAIVDGKNYPYTLVKPGLAKGLPYTVGGRPQENTLFISSDVPEAFRPFIIGHEAREYTTFAGQPPEEACLEAIKAELEDVKRNAPVLYTHYILGDENVVGRREFFEAMYEFVTSEEQANNYSEPFKEGIKRARDYLNGLEIVPVGTFESEYTPEQVAAIRKVHEVGEQLAKAHPEIADRYRDLTYPSCYIDIACEFIPEWVEESPEIAKKAVGHAIRSLIPPTEQAELTAQHKAWKLEERLGGFGSEEHREHQRKASRARHDQGIPVDVEAMLRARGRVAWSDEERRMVLDVMLGDKDYQTKRNALDFKKMANALNSMYHNGEAVRYENSVRSFIAHTMMQERQQASINNS